MEESTIIMDHGAIARGQCGSALETILREGGRRLLQEALELEVQQYIERFQQLKSESGQGLVVRNGYHQERELVTGAGKVPVRQPRVHDRRPTEHFTSTILPPYLRRTPSIDALIPALYLKGVSTSAFPEALQAILGDGVVGLSANNVVRLKQVWEQEFQAWSKRDLHGKRYVYLWADAVYFNVRLQKDRPCVLVVVGATEDGHKELLAIQDGERESHLSWLHLLQDLKARGLKEHSFLAVADGALGFWRKRCLAPAPSSVGCIRRPMSSTSCPSGCALMPRVCCTRCTWRPPERMPWRPTTASWAATRTNIPRPASVCARTAT